MPISPVRIQQDIAAIARATQSPGQGAHRPTFSHAWREARDYVIEQVRTAGCEVRVDAAGNVHARSSGIGWDRPVWLSGSHLDSVPHGGDFDGVVGVVAPLEVLRAAQEDGCAPLALELVIFAEEEGTTFGLGMLGSRTWAGTLDAARLADLRNAEGQSYLEAGAAHGVEAQALASGRRQPPGTSPSVRTQPDQGADAPRSGGYLGFVELHIEQGPAMWNRDQPVALVTAINGRRQYRVELRGVANHAGSTSMSDRRDALAGAAEFMVALESLMPALSPQAVATVGHIECWPNAVNVIPKRLVMTIDFRAPQDELLARGDVQIRQLAHQGAARRSLTAILDETESLPAVNMDPGVCDRLRQATVRLNREPLPETVSGALHDAAILAPLMPTAMLFVASRGGISHNPDEFSRIEDIAAAAEILYEAIQP